MDESFPVKVFKVEVMIIDFDNIGEEGIKSCLEHTKFPNHCIHPKVKSFDSREVQWHDGHPLNDQVTCDQAYKDLFSIKEKKIESKEIVWEDRNFFPPKGFLCENCRKEEYWTILGISGKNQGVALCRECFSKTLSKRTKDKTSFRLFFENPKEKQDELVELKKDMPCGHDVKDLVSSTEGTIYCSACEEQAKRKEKQDKALKEE